MEMIRYVLFLVLVTCMLVVSIIMLVQEIKAIKKIRVKSNDGNIEAIVVSHCSDVPRGFQPVVQYNVNGIEEKYIYIIIVIMTKKNIQSGKK